MKKTVHIVAALALICAANGYAAQGSSWRNWRPWFSRQPSYYKPSESELQKKFDAEKSVAEIAQFKKDFLNRPDKANAQELNFKSAVIRTLDTRNPQIAREIRTTGDSPTLRNLEKQYSTTGGMLSPRESINSTIGSLKYEMTQKGINVPQSPPQSWWQRWFTPKSKELEVKNIYDSMTIQTVPSRGIYGSYQSSKPEAYRYHIDE